MAEPPNPDQQLQSEAEAEAEAQSQSQSQSHSEAQLQPTPQENDIDAAAPTQSASPPLPPRHTALTPGPRASRFQDVLESSLAHTLSKLTYENLASCYPTLAVEAPKVLRGVQERLVLKLGQNCRESFDKVNRSRDIVAKLNELETLVSEAERRRDEAGEKGAEAPIPPHMLPADEVLAAHLAPHLALQQSQLNAKLQTTQAHNARLFEEIQKQRAEIESLVGFLEKAFEDIDGASHMMDGVVDDLAKETRMIEVEMAGS
ncbi:Uu.00g004290.m01.CDS01 [Anthostomella pinea]|uniref:Uu.00g004290.m01.CDS01 n=1 Tax=Anthostomella pinea TaxID=933095 RepID=A0AAI8YGD6_9PEZI|nr:Uu.00g004290.m01.CDS01 [Anthostomella pinea]